MEMIKFCRCNDLKEYKNTHTEFFDHKDSVKQFDDERCLLCSLPKWSNPLHENMLFDLREMNLIW